MYRLPGISSSLARIFPAYCYQWSKKYLRGQDNSSADSVNQKQLTNTVSLSLSLSHFGDDPNLPTVLYDQWHKFCYLKISSIKSLSDIVSVCKYINLYSV